MQEKKNFIDFILDASKSETLTKGFLKAGSKKDLQSFFKDLPYLISPEDISKLLEIKNKLPDIPPWGPSPSPKY